MKKWETPIPTTPKRREYDLFDTYQEAFKFRDRINSYNKPLAPGETVPDWYMYAEAEIKLIEEP